MKQILIHRTPATPALAGGARESTRDYSVMLVISLALILVACSTPHPRRTIRLHLNRLRRQSSWWKQLSRKWWRRSW